MVVLPQMQDLADDISRRCVRRAARRPGSIGESGITVFVISLSPFVERLP
jgi:hypothetical protein